MFCEFCGCSLEQDAKFCTSCGNPTIDESNQLVAEVNAIEDAWTYETHRELFWDYFVKGIIGFLLGTVFAIAMDSPEGFVVLGLVFAGVPYGWNLITRITGGRTLYGSVGIVLLYYMLKLFLSLLIAVTVYPPLLFYHLMMSQKPKSATQSVCVVIFILSIIASLFILSSLFM